MSFLIFAIISLRERERERELFDSFKCVVTYVLVSVFVYVLMYFPRGHVGWSMTSEFCIPSDTNLLLN